MFPHSRNKRNEQKIKEKSFVLLMKLVFLDRSFYCQFVAGKEFLLAFVFFS